MANILYRKQKQQKSLDNGVTWIDTGEYRVGDIIENPSNCTSDDTKQCRWVELPESEGYYCDGYSKYTMQVEECTENGLIWTRTGNSQRGNTLIESKSTDCGYEELIFNSENITRTTGYSMSVSSLDEKYIVGYNNYITGLYAVYDNKYYYRYSTSSTYTYDLITKELIKHTGSLDTEPGNKYKEYDATNKVLPNNIIMAKYGYFNLDTFESKYIGKYFYNSPTTVVVENKFQESYSLYNLENDTVEELELYYQMTDDDPSSENQIRPEYPKECFKKCILGEDFRKHKKGETVYVRMRYNDVKFILGERFMVFPYALICKKSTKYDNVLIPIGDASTDFKYSNGVITTMSYNDVESWYEEKGYYLLNDYLITNGVGVINLNTLEQINIPSISTGVAGFFSNYRILSERSFTNFVITDFNNLTDYYSTGQSINLNGRDGGPGFYTNILYKNGELNPFSNEILGIDDGENGFNYKNRCYSTCASYNCGSINIGGELYECAINSVYINILNGNLIISLSLYEKYNDYSYLFLDIPVEEFIKCTNLYYIEFNI